MAAAACRRNRDELKTAAPLSRKSLGQRSVEDGRRGTFDNEELVFHRETPPEADIRTEAAMEMKDLGGAERSHNAGERNRLATTQHMKGELLDLVDSILI